MRLRILTLLCYLSVLILATGRLKDQSEIDDLQNLLLFLVDDKKFVQASELFTPNATYDPGPEFPVRPFQGRSALVDYLEKTIPDNVSTFAQLGTKLIKFIPPFNKDGRSDRAEAVSYVTFTFFGADNSTEIIFFKFEDKEIVRTKEPGFGGWRIQNRKQKLVVSFQFHNYLCRLSSNPLPVVPQRDFYSKLIQAIFQGNPYRKPRHSGRIEEYAGLVVRRDFWHWELDFFFSYMQPVGL